MQNDENATFKYYDIVYRDWIPPQRTQAELNLIKNLVNKSANILDLGCGSGRHLIPLHQQGYHIQGVDILPQALKLLKAKDNTAKANLGNIFQTVFKPASCDLILSMWNALAQLALTDAQAIKLFTRVKSLLKPNGIFLFDLSTDTDLDSEWDHTYTVQNDGKEYILHWTLLNYDQATKTTKSREHIVVKDANKHIIDDVASNITQKWWQQKEIEDIAHTAGLQFQVITLNGIDYLYYLLGNK